MHAVLNSPAQAATPRPWWREPMMWLVLGGPLLVVVAGIVTFVLAVRMPDPVIADDYYKRGLEINKTLAEQQRQAEAAQAAVPEALRPALQARNHSATPAEAR